jgi:hypothetical protein
MEFSAPLRDEVMLGRQASAMTPRVSAEWLPGPEVERFGMVPAVVLSQGLADSARPVRDRPVADLATRDREMGDRHRETAG